MSESGTGPDGKTVIAALNPGGYGSNVYTDLSKEPTGPAAASGPQLTSEQLAQPHAAAVRRYRRPRPPEQDWVKRIELDGKVLACLPTITTSAPAISAEQPRNRP